MRLSRSFALPLVATICGAAILPPGARAGAADNEPPEITPQMPRLPAPGKPVVIECDIADQSEIFAPLVYWRATGHKEYASPPLLRVSGTRFRGEIVVPPGIKSIDYFLEAFDAQGNGPARVGNQSAPLKLSLEVPKAPPPQLVTTAPNPAEPSPPSKVPAIAALAGGGLALVVGVVFALSAGSAHDEFLTTYAPARRPGLAASVKSDSLLADVATGVGIAALATGAALLLMGPAASSSGSEGEEEFHVSVAPSWDGLFVRAEF